MNLSAIFFIAAVLLLSSIAGPAWAQDESPTNPPAKVDVTSLPENPNPPMPPPEVAAELEPEVPPAPPEPLPEQPAVEEAVTAAPPIAAESTAPVAAPAEKPPAEAAPTLLPITPTPAITETIPVPAAEGPAAEKPTVEEPQAGEPLAEEPAKVKPDAPAITPAAIPPLPPLEPSIPAVTPLAEPIEQPTETPVREAVEQPAEPEVADEAAPEPAVEKPEAAEPPTALPAPGTEVSTQITIEAVAPEPLPEEAAAEIEEEVFELERGGLPAQTQPGKVVEEAAPSPPPKVPLWQRLIGRTPTTTAVSEEAEASAAPEAKPAEKALTQEELIAAQEEVRRQAKEVEALKALDLAYQAMGRNEFEEAVKLFNQALNLMPVRPHTLETRQKAKQSQAECEYRLALNYYKAGKYGDAKAAIQRALGYHGAHQRAMRLSEQIKRDEDRRDKIADRPTPPRLAPEYLDRQKQVQAAIERGRQYYAIGQHENARREFRNVLALDDKNEEAAAHLKKLAEKLSRLEVKQMERQQAEMMAQVRDTWTPPVRRELAERGGPIQPVTSIPPGKRRLLDKLNSIQIPQLEFRAANILDVISYLDKVSRANDKESPPGEEGVNFILQLKRPGAAEAAPSVPAEPVEGELLGEGEAVSAAPVSAAAAIPTVTLSLRNIVLMDAIKYITEVTGLKYRIEENVVVITPSDMLIGELVTRTYKVQPSMVDTIIGAGGSAGGGGAAVEFGAPTPTVERGDVKKFFVDAGVPFPQDTSIVYKPSLNLLIVKNTAENLENFERILNSLNVVPVQVEIEARFVEVAQRDLEELGLEWILTDNWELAQDASANAPLQLSARERIQMNQNTPSKGLRNLVLGASGVSATPGGNLAGVLSISSVLTNPEVTMILHALEQRSGANLLSAPKVTTKSGANAEIKVVRELIYPTEFALTQGQVSQGSGATAGSVVTPSFVTPAGFEKRDTGVILNVTPTVGPDGFSIDLVMLPQVVELAEWINYGSTISDAQGNPQVLNMPQPIFHTRTITTGITIWDGQTVVMGGLITEGQTTTKDKVPVLGDIPLLGALFRSETSDSQKFNLLIFVTANLVDPAGNKINKEVIATATPSATPIATP